jgi:hypothetical protein
VTSPAGGAANAGSPGGAGSVAALRERLPDLRLAADLARLAGPDGRYGGCDDATVVVAVGRLTALIGALEARRLEALRAVVRRNPAAGPAGASDGDLPGAWLEDAGIQVGLELARGPKSVGPMLELAVALARLPLTEQALRDGVLDYSRTKLIVTLTANLSGDLAAAAERELLAGGWVEGKTWSQILRRLSRIVINLDPDAARKRRETAERFARVVFGAEGDGTARLAGYNLPADEALQADARISARARAYRAAGLAGSMELLRAQAFLDLLAGLDRRTSSPAGSGSPAGGDRPGGDSSEPDSSRPEDETGGDEPGGDEPGGDETGGDEPGGDDDGQDSGTGDGDGDGGPGGDGGLGGPGGVGPAAGTGDGLAANIDLTIPLATLLGLAERAGEADWLGAIDPELARRLAALAAGNPRSNFRIIVTSENGYAAGFGIARRRPGGTGRRRPGRERPPPDPAGSASTRGSSPMAEMSPAGRQPALPGLGQAGGPGQAGGLGTWRIRIGGLDLTADLHVIGRDGCGHELATTAYKPTALLRALVQIRDGKCSLPVCARHPSGCEWEHGIPWPEGPTCGCNGGLHCKRDHLLKQSDRWSIRQLPDGRRVWTAPTGLEYTSQLHDYPD